MKPKIGEISIPVRGGTMPLKILKYGSVNLPKEQNGCSYQFTLGNQVNDTRINNKTKYICKKPKKDENSKVTEFTMKTFRAQLQIIKYIIYLP
jgi:hypothetical protein